MKKQLLIILVFLSPLFALSQNVEVVGGIIADSINVSSGLIKNVADPVDAQDAVTKAYVDSLILLLDIQLGNKIQDVDGNIYGKIQIGDQLWMTENLRTTKYNDGTAIPLAADAGTWETVGTNGTPAYSWYENVASNLTTYGALYNWYAIGTMSNGDKNVCPVGWHVPTKAEWDILATYLGGEGVAGGKMKATGTQYWLSPNTAATNESGFSGLPGGRRGASGSFSSIGLFGFWWSSTEFNILNARYLPLGFNNGNASTGINDKGDGYSVRCLRDD